jgi:hypothetical protein
MNARYLNVDLLIESKFDLSPLTDFLEGKVFFLYNERMDDGRYLVGLESNIHDSTDANEDLTELLHILETFPHDVRSIWGRCSKRTMDIGFECGAMEQPINSTINSQIIQRLAQLNCAINIRIYPCVDE